MKTRVIGVSIALSLVMLVGVGCGGGGVVPEVPDVPAAVDGVEQDIYAGSVKAIAILTSTLELADAISLVEDEAARAGNIPAEADAAFDRAMLAYLDANDAAVAQITQGVATWEELRAHTQPVIDRVNDLSLLSDQVGVIKSSVGTWIRVLVGIVAGALGDITDAAA